MAEIKAFAGIRYDKEKVGDISLVVSPPYDVISPTDRIYYHNIHPNNFIRLILGEEFDTDNDKENRFTRASDYLNRWMEDGILVRDVKPGIYVYRQFFERDGSIKTVRGFICIVKLHKYEDNVILPHENTLAKPKSQLIELIRNTKCNLDSVYGLYADKSGAIDEILNRAELQQALVDIVDKDNVRHVLWLVDNQGDIDLISNALLDKQIAIADGHHRYETALAYRDEIRASNPGSSELASDYTLMTLINVYEPDMTIFPTHRVIANIDENLLMKLDSSISDKFELYDSARHTIKEDMARLGGIGLYRNGSATVLVPKENARDMISGSEASRELELNVLHSVILEPLLGIDKDKLRNQSHIFYTRSEDEAFELVDSGNWQMAFLLNNIDVKAVLDIASAGDRMPQKATYFYPKLLSGLVLRAMDE